MKKLLAIAVAAAVAAPMAAMADTTVYGKVHMSVGVIDNVSGIFVESHSSRIGLKGSNALDNGLTATHQLEIGYNFTDEEGDLTPRNSWIGLKGGFGEFRVGRQTTPYSIVDDAAAFPQRNDHGLHTFQRVPNALAYINKFGSVGFAAAYVAAGEAEGGTSDDAVTNLLLNYSAGPLYAGVAYQGMPSGAGDDGLKLVAAYKGANYAAGVVNETLPGSGNNVTTISGKYSFGKAYVVGQYGEDSDSKADQANIEIGYKLGKGTIAYYEYEDIADAAGVDTKTNRVGLVHKF